VRKAKTFAPPKGEGVNESRKFEQPHSRIHHGESTSARAPAAGWSRPGSPSRAACDFLLRDCLNAVSLALPGLLRVALRAGRNEGSSRPARAARRDAADRARVCFRRRSRHAGRDGRCRSAGRWMRPRAASLCAARLCVSDLPPLCAGRAPPAAAAAAGAPAADRNERAFSGSCHTPLAGTPRVWPALPCGFASIASGSILTTACLPFVYRPPPRKCRIPKTSHALSALVSNCFPVLVLNCSWCFDVGNCETQNDDEKSALGLAVPPCLCCSAYGRMNDLHWADRHLCAQLSQALTPISAVWVSMMRSRRAWFPKAWWGRRTQGKLLL
jgi:hypothetical protein